MQIRYFVNALQLCLSVILFCLGAFFAFPPSTITIAPIPDTPTRQAGQVSINLHGADSDEDFLIGRIRISR